MLRQREPFSLAQETTFRNACSKYFFGSLLSAAAVEEAEEERFRDNKTN